eukprot:6466496-Amphidinium_carterae.1
MVDLQRMWKQMEQTSIYDRASSGGRPVMDREILGLEFPSHLDGATDVCTLGYPRKEEELPDGPGAHALCHLGRGTNQSSDRSSGGARNEHGRCEPDQPQTYTEGKSEWSKCQHRPQSEPCLGECGLGGGRDTALRRRASAGCRDGHPQDGHQQQRGRIITSVWHVREGLITSESDHRSELMLWLDDGVHHTLPRKVRTKLLSCLLALTTSFSAWPMEGAMEEPSDLAEIAAPEVEEEEVDDWTPTTQQLKDIQIAHDNSGHPPPQRFAQLLRLGGAPKQLVRYILREWRCPTCVARQRPQPRPPAANLITTEPNHTLGIDLVELANPTEGGTDYWLNICCWSTSYMQVKRLENKEASTTLAAFLDTWIRWMGWPKVVIVDQGSEFAGCFGEFVSQNGCVMIVTDARAPWQNSKTERLGGEWKEQMANLLHSWQPLNSEEWENMGVMAVLARNSCIDGTGYSPQQRMIGAGHRLPMSLSGQRADDIDPEFLWQGPRDDVRRREELRQAAWKSLIETQSKERLLRALRAQHRLPLKELQIGELVMIWRQPGHQRGSWHGPGSVVLSQGQHVWCAVRGNIWKINRTHVRPATNEESQGQELLQKYLQTVTEELKGSNRGPKRFMDGTQEPAPPERPEGLGPQPSNPTDVQSGERISKQPRLHEPASQVTTPGGAAESSSPPFRSGQGYTPQRSTVLPYPAPNQMNLVAHTANDCDSGIPEITLKDTLQKEVKVAELHPEHQRLFVDDIGRGRGKEWRSIAGSAAVRIHVGDAAKRLQQQYPQRLIPSRWLDRWKHAGADHDNQLDPYLRVDKRVEAKSRWVVQGFWDPDLEQINRSTPCPTAQDLMLTLQLLAALEVEAFTADVRTAFMQSEPGLRGGQPLFARLPPGGVPAIEGQPRLIGDDAIVELLAEVYGLNSGPMGWRITLTKKLHQQGFRSHPLSPCLFLFYNKDDKLCGAVIVETDDLLFGGKGGEFRQAMLNIRESFRFGHWQSLKHQPADYSGRRIVQRADFGFEVEMVSYLREKATNIALTRERRQQPTDPLTDEERTQYRGLIGSLTWASRMAMPQLAGEVSIMASRCNRATVMDAVLVNAMLAKHLKTATPIQVQPIPLDQLCLLAFVDASLANIEEHRSQAGHLICACDRGVLQGELGKVSILTYSSHTLHRVVGSTLMAETCALTEALSEVTWVCKWLAMSKNVHFVWNETQQPDREIQIQTVLKADSSELRVALVTDAKSVFDNVRKHQEAYTNHDKRVSLELAVVRDGLRMVAGECRWVPHFANPADCLTKLKGNVDRLLQLMKEGSYRLVDEATTIQDRQEQRAQGETIPRPSKHTSN